MQFLKNNAGVIAVVALVIAIIGVYTPAGRSVSSYLGGVTNYDEIDVTALKVGGSNGTRMGVITHTASCTLIVPVATQTASTTQPYDCAVTGVVSGDTVFAQFASTTGLTAFGSGGQWSIVGAKASSTAGFVTVLIRNETGAAANVSATGIASSTNILTIHPVTTVPGL